VADLDAVAEAWSALGRQLAASRRAAGLSQEQLAPLADFSRSTIANAETGRQRVTRRFWERCDTALETGGALARGHDQVAEAQRGAHLQSAVVARQARTTLGGTAGPVATRPTKKDCGGGVDGSAGLAQVESLREWLLSGLMCLLFVGKRPAAAALTPARPG
jgi:DNA-binding XRE family transcriptional regulator